LQYLSSDDLCLRHQPPPIQGAEFETADSMTPFDVAVRILDNQLRSLMWIDEKVGNSSIPLYAHIFEVALVTYRRLTASQFVRVFVLLC
jgi:hypothetical protein